jgi:hypothetical protein
VCPAGLSLRCSFIGGYDEEVRICGRPCTLTCTSAMAQSSQGQAAGQAGVNGNAANSPTATTPGTTGMNAQTKTGVGAEQRSPNGSPTAAPRATTGPAGQPSKDETSPK